MDEVFRNLESNNSKLVDESKKELTKAFTQTKENWLVNGMMDYFITTNSKKIVEILVKVQAPHDTFIFDKLCEWINTSKRHQAFAMFGQIILKHPSWLYKVVNHQLLREMLRVVRTERNITNTLHGLFCIHILLPIIPGLMIEFLPDLFMIFLNLSTWKATNSPPLIDNQPVYLQNGIERLFQRLYGMYPCNFVAFLRDRIQDIAYTKVIEPLLLNVKVHPMLLLSDKEMEKNSSRWKEMEPHDVVYECEKFTLDDGLKPQQKDEERHDIPWFRQISNPNSVQAKVDRPENTFAPISSVDNSQSRPRAKSIKWDNIWTPSSAVLATPPPTSAQTPTPTMITQNFSIQLRSSDDWKSYSNSQYTGSGASPPEAAVEATPETTPLRDYGKPQRPYPVHSNAARTIWGNSSQPSSPMKREEHFRYPDAMGSNSTSEKFLKMVHDRNEIKDLINKQNPSDEYDDIVVQGPSDTNENTLNSSESSKEDDEVTEINKHKMAKTNDTQGNADKDIRSRSNLMKYHEMKSMEESFGGSIEEFFSSRNKKQQPNYAIAKNNGENSGQHVKSTNSRSIETQTDITLPIASHSLLGKYVETSLKRQTTSDSNTRTEAELQLLYLQLQYERYRREVYAERNRRLLGKSRVSEEHKMDNEKLKFQVEKLTKDFSSATEHFNKAKIAQSHREQELSTECNGLRDEVQNQLVTNKKLQLGIETLDRQLAEENEDKKRIANALESAQAEIFDLKNLLRQCQYQADVGAKYKEELQRLHSREVLMGEMKLKCSEKLTELSNLQAKESETNQMKAAYLEEVKELKAELGVKCSQLDTAKERTQIVEAQLLREKGLLAEQKRCVKLVKEEYEEKLKAVESKYTAQKAIILRMEESILDPRMKSNVNSEPDKSDTVGSLDHASPLSMSLASSEGMSWSQKSVAEIKNLSHLLESSSTTFSPSSLNGEASSSNRVAVSEDIPVPTSSYYLSNL